MQISKHRNLKTNWEIQIHFANKNKELQKEKFWDNKKKKLQIKIKQLKQVFAIKKKKSSKYLQ